MKNEKIAKHITGWLSRYLDKSGARGFVVGAIKSLAGTSIVSARDKN